MSKTHVVEVIVSGDQAAAVTSAAVVVCYEWDALLRNHPAILDGDAPCPCFDDLFKALETLRANGAEAVRALVRGMVFQQSQGRDDS